MHASFFRETVVDMLPPSVPCAKATPLHRVAAMLRAFPASIRSRPRRRVAFLLLLSVATSESSCPAGAESAQGWCAPYPKVSQA